MRATTARKEEEKAKGKEGVSSSTPHSAFKGSVKRKADGKDDPPSKKVAVSPGVCPPRSRLPSLVTMLGKE